VRRESILTGNGFFVSFFKYLATAMRRPTEDTYRHKGLRKKLVDTIRSKGVTDEKVLDAINRVPRHFFLDSAFDELAYEDRAFPIGEGQTISQPYTVAYQSQLLELKPFTKVLEIGTGSAYQAVILAEMGAQVYTIERQRKLFDQNKTFAFLKKYLSIKLFYGDGYEGLPTYAPFDRVLITAAAPEIPEKLIDQLRPGGIMVIPVGMGDVQRMMRVTKLSSGSGEETGALKEEVFDNFSFVPMLGGKNN
jgi:protein-L-isoaspartate(D-aspartate) O-methyltransferase